MPEFEWVYLEIDGDTVRLARVKRNLWQRLRRWLRWQRHMRVVRRDRRQYKGGRVNFKKKLVEFVGEFAEELTAQLEKDQLRWGDTWKRRPRENQEARAMARFQDYFDQWKNAGTPMPWLKIAGEALIAWVRENHPEELEP